MKILLLFSLAIASYAQGVASKSTMQVLQVPAGSIHCTFINYQPAAMTGLHIDCTSAVGSVMFDVVVAVSPSPGPSGKFLSGADIVTWKFMRPAVDGPLMYQIEANGKTEAGTL